MEAMREHMESVSFAKSLERSDHVVLAFTNLAMVASGSMHALAQARSSSPGQSSGRHIDRIRHLIQS